MQLHNTLKSNLLLVMLLLVFAGCSKENIYRPGIPKGTRFPVVTISGFTLDSLQVRVGPRSNTAGYLFEEISDKAFQIPFDSTQTVSRIVLYKKDGTTPYAGSQFRFENKYKDTTINIFYDGINVVQSPVFPKPSAGTMNFRVTFKSNATKYRGPVDLELHEAYLKTFYRPVLDSAGNPIIDTVNTKPKPRVEAYDSTLVKPEIVRVIQNVRRTEFNPFFELPTPTSARALGYAFYVHLPGTTTPLNYPANVVVTPFDIIFFDETMAGTTGIVTIADNRLETEKPNRINYIVNDVARFFPQEF